MAIDERLICESAELADGGKGVKFDIDQGMGEEAAFVVRFHGRVRGFLNECAHIPVEMDWMEGEFFDLSKTYIVCATHGAYYSPESGVCLGGPCKGQRLKKIDVVEHDGKVFWIKHES